MKQREGRAKRALCAALAMLMLAGAPATAQLAPQGEVAGFAIVRAEQSGICFAVREGTSAQGDRMIYSTYRTPAGQRWRVAGYVDAAKLPGGEVEVGLSVDGRQMLRRRTEVRDGDFMFPFETLDEVEAFEAAIAEGTELIVSIDGGADRLNVDLESLRAALAAVQTCATEQR